MNSRRRTIGWVVLALSAGLLSAPAQSPADEGPVTNGSFEVGADHDQTLPAGWFGFWSGSRTISRTDSAARSGTMALKMGSQGKKDAGAGIAVSLPVEPNRTYQLTAYATANTNDLLSKTAYGAIGIEWKDADNKEISRITSPSWNRMLSRKRWEQFTVQGKAPKNAASAMFVIYVFDGGEPSSGSFLVDDASVNVR